MLGQLEAGIAWSVPVCMLKSDGQEHHGKNLSILVVADSLSHQYLHPQ